jgi:hypothetical protein
MGDVCKSSNITTPCEKNQWHVEGHALYIQPNAPIYNIPYSLSSGTQTLNYGINPNWGWGFQLGAGYDFGEGYDAIVEWYHFRNSNSEYSNTPGTLNYSYPSGTAINIVKYSEQFSNSVAWDQVNIEFGEAALFSEHRLTRLHGGVAFSHLANQTYDFFNESIKINNQGGTPQNRDDLTATSSFNGFGPRLGIDLNYAWKNGIGIYAKGAGSLLAGATKSNYSGVGVINYTTSSNRAIGALDAKIGLSYQYHLYDQTLTLDYGWLWASYFNALGRKDNSESSLLSLNSNFEIQGLYFGLKWTGHMV